MMPLILVLSLTGSAADCPEPMRPAPFVLTFPEAGLDDPAAYEGYRTRFYRDAADNTVQVYIRESEGRAVALLANSANESVGFTARTAAGDAVPLVWAADTACTGSTGLERTIEFTVRARDSELRIGHFVLGSMRVERDVQYSGGHLRPFGAPFVLPELDTLVDVLAALPDPSVRARHAGLLGAPDAAALRARLRPTVAVATRGAERVARVEQPSLDGRNRLVLELALPAADGVMALDGPAVRVRAVGGRALVLTVRITTDAAALTPLARSGIFNAGFLAFLDSARAAHDRALADIAGAESDPRVQRYRRLERQVRGFELVASREKLMAGLPNYATYFGRDILVTALLMQPVWAAGMNEYVLASVLDKLAPDGQVSHEEALGGQAIREHATEYVALLRDWRRARDAGDAPAARTALDRAESILAAMQRVRENYAMVDDEFQLPILAARYLVDPEVPPARKRAFLEAAGSPDGGAARLQLLLRNLRLVADMTAAYVRQPVAANLIAFREREPGVYHAASWRDSGAGYGNGRYAMDVNTIWAPHAIASIATILQSLRTLGFTDADLERVHPGMRGSALGRYMTDPPALAQAVETWRGAIRHFTVRLTREEAAERIAQKLAALAPEEGRYWSRVLSRHPIPEGGIEFAALSLDARGEPIPVLSSDLGMRWFLDDITGDLLDGPGRIGSVLRELQVSYLRFPAGLFVDGLGPLVANDAYAPPAVRSGFERDDYHSPRVVWGREVSLLLLGLMRQIDTARDENGALRDIRLAPYVAALEDALARTREAVTESGLQHNELWTYRIAGDRLLPVRWGRSTDIQLWNLTNLVVEFRLDRR